MMKILSLISVVMFGMHGAVSNDDPQRPLRAVSEVDPARYAGTWYEVARLPNRFQEECAGEVTATYTLLDDGEFQVVNRCRAEGGELSEVEGRARRADPEGPNSKLLVRFAPAFLGFLPFVWGDYWIIDLAADYSYAVIGEPRREYLWVLARTPVLAEPILQAVLDSAIAQGYDLSALIRTRQTR